MAGIYIHIPFCKQACSYCNFHFSTSLRRKNELVRALLSEMAQRRDYLKNECIETIYFGGGTPSLLQISDFELLMEKIYNCFEIVSNAEITVEANPDDVTDNLLKGWKEIGVNRLSVGIQSFYDEDLKWMNRAHNREQALRSLRAATRQFNNITIDLIYGTPVLTNAKWKKNIEMAIRMDIPHLSCYALTVEPKTPLYKLIREKRKEDVNASRQAQQFLMLMEWMEAAGYGHYEISNFSKPGFRSRHNSSYWQGKNYIGFGPSAHSFDGNSRQWNIANNTIYIDSINKGVVPCEREILSPVQKANEYTMTSLRTAEGLDLGRMGNAAGKELRALSKKFIDRGWMLHEQGHLKLTREGKLFADGIAAALFLSPVSA